MLARKLVESRMVVGWRVDRMENDNIPVFIALEYEKYLRKKRLCALLFIERHTGNEKFFLQREKCVYSFNYSVTTSAGKMFPMSVI